MRTAGARCSSRAARHREHVVRLDRGQRVHASVLRHAGTVGGLGGAEHEGRGLVDVPLRAVQLGVRRREHRVLRRRVLEELRWHRVASPRVGIRRGHAAERGPQLRGRRARSRATVSPSVDRSAVSTAEYINGALMNPAARSGAGMISSAGRIDSSGATSSPCTVSTGADTRDATAEVAVLRLAPHDDGHVEVAARDGEACTGERGQLQHAELGDHRTRARADPLGDDPTRIAVAPRASRHEHRARARQQLRCVRHPHRRARPRWS